MMPDLRALFMHDAWFWAMLGADFLLVVSTFFSIFYLVRLALQAILPHKFDVARRFPGVLSLAVLSLAASLTPLDRIVTGWWRGVLAMALGERVESEWFPDLYFIVWLGVAALSLIVVIVQYLVLAGSLRRLPVVEDPSFVEACGAVGLARPVSLRNCGTRASTCSWGVTQPCVLVPSAFLATFSPDERRIIYTHELLHIRDYDTVKYFLVSLFKALFWFHPIVRHALRTLTNGMEIACDRQTLRVSGADPSLYARLILKALHAGRSLAPGFSFGKTEFRDRLGHIVDETAFLALPRRAALLPVASLIVLIIMGFATRKEYIEAEWNLRPPEQQEVVRDGKNFSLVLDFYWNGALGTYAKVTPRERNSM